MAKAVQPRQSRLDSLAARMMQLDSPVYGDERERNVVFEATGFGWTVGYYLAGLSALAAIVLGHVATSLVLLALACVPVVAAQWYAGRRTVDFVELAARDPRAVRRSQTVTLVFVVLFCLALGYLAYTGRPLLAPPHLDLFDIGAMRAGLLGAAGGGVIGALVGLVWQGVTARRKQAKPLDADEPDDVF